MVKWRNKRSMMKKFRFAPIHLLMAGVISFIILVICLRLFGDSFAMLAALFVVLALLVLFFIQQQRVSELDEIEQIHYVNHQAEGSLASLLDKMPVGVIKISEENGDVEWFNPYAELIFTTEDGDFDADLLQNIMQTAYSDTGHYATVGDKKYSVYLDQASGVFYFFDASNEYEATVGLVTTRPVIGIISVDNYDDLEDVVSDTDISHINSFVANFVAEFAEQFRMFYRRVGMDRFYLFTDYTVLDQLMENKFSIIDQFRKEAQNRELPLTLSMGFSYGDGNHDEIGKTALLNLNLAEVRGGDQAVVRENDEAKNPVYFGGGTAASVKRTRTRTRAMMTAISDKIKSVDQVFVVGHRNLDMDALGASLGMQLFASNIIDQAYVVYDPAQMAADIERAVHKLESEGADYLLPLQTAASMVTSRSLLIMVDHSKTALTLSKEFFDQFSQTIVVDHHRRDEDFPGNAVIAYIESGASSASELVTELIQFQNSKKNRLSKMQASILMAGIMLDTKGFSARVTSRTFDVASYLRTRGSDSVVIQDISATNFEEYRAVNELILNGRKILPNVIVAAGPEENTYDTVVISKAADTMLSMSGIEATFVVSRNTKGYVSISARSRSKINVQRIMEKLGGGGHFNLAAAQIEGHSVAEVVQTLNQEIMDQVIKDEVMIDEEKKT
ncbi:DHH family phosphoesterase [Streptococcus panodentis]|uniref:Cyclic-di-AMP phosphodiesterase n=1 Tax=Streptococcus panodentis TaxID=1581472 RepID=A0ABS5AUL1_9STRE|nr:DHH family phosphoesterase [Streptococcus panodentis]MBP2620258.1 DHH family phosphoesterase [Streptococcus panodentis]